MDNEKASGTQAGDDLEFLTDPAEGAFRIGMPKGWQNRTTLYRARWWWRALAEAHTPGNETVLFVGDPNIPNFMEPNEYLNEYTPLPSLDPSLRIQRFVPAEPFFVDYVHQRYSKLLGFRMLGCTPCPAYTDILRETARKSGTSLNITVVRVSFTFNDSGKTLRGWVNGATFTNGMMWMAEVNGVITTDDPMLYDALLLNMVASVQMNPVWQEREKARVAQESAQSRIQHENTMAMINNNTRILTQGHQMRMQDIQNAGNANTSRWQQQQVHNDASFQSWQNQQAHNDTAFQHGQNQQAASDASQQSFVNTMREEHTVADANGQTYQVDSHQERYYVNTNDNTYIGTGATTEQSDLGKTFGVNQDQYEEVKIIR